MIGASDVIALAAAIVASLSLLIAIQTRRDGRESFIRSMRDRWDQQRDGWNLILMLRRGSSFYYAYATREAQEYADELLPQLDSSDQRALREAKAKVRPVGDFLAGAGHALLAGRWTIDDAYEVFGADLARHHETVSWMGHRRWGHPGWDAERRHGALAQIPEWNMFDHQDCLLLLSVIMRAEQCRRRDTYAHFCLELAEQLRDPRKGRDIWQTLRRARRVRGRRLPAWSSSIGRLFWGAARPTLEQLIAHEESPIIKPNQYWLIRKRPFELGSRRDRRVKRALGIPVEAETH